MEITRSFYKNLVLIAGAILASVSPVFSAFAFSDYGEGLIQYYCTSSHSFFGFAFFGYENCPVYVVIGYIIFLTCVLLLFLFVLVLILDILKNLLIQPNIKIFEDHGYDHESVYDDAIRANVENHYACLKIINREQEELTNCYVILRSIYTFHPEFGLVPLTSWVFDGDKKLGWKNGKGCEMKIGPRMGQEPLRVYKLGVDLGNNSKVSSYFNICDDNHRGFNSGNDNGVTVYFFEIEVYGKLKDRDIRPKKFFGQVKVEFSKTDSGATFGVDVWKVNPLAVALMKLITFRSNIRKWIAKNDKKNKAKAK